MARDSSESSQDGRQPRRNILKDLHEDEGIPTVGGSRLSISPDGQPVLQADLTAEQAARLVGGGPLATGQQTKASVAAATPGQQRPRGDETAYHSVQGSPTAGGGNQAYDPHLAETIRRRLAERAVEETKSDDSGASTPANNTQQPYVCIGGEWIKVATTPKNITADSSYVIYPKEDRVNMSADAQQQLKESFLKRKKWCQLREITLDAAGIDGKTIDADSLKDTLRLSKVIENIRKWFRVYDVYNVSHVILFNATNPTVIESSKDIFLHFLTLTSEQVARSNRWYNTMADNQWTQQNMSLQLEFFSIHMDPTILDTVKVAYERYPLACRGGPLLFHLATTHLVNRSKHLGDTLLARLRNIRISELPGEDVLKALSYVRVALPILTEYNNRPDDIVATVLTIFQTTTHSDFNAVLKTMESNRVLKQAVRESQGRNALSRTDRIKEEDKELEETLTTIQHLASTTFKLDWPGVKASQQSAFPAQSGAPSGGGDGEKPVRTCFNCGKPNCSVSTCPRPKNEALITANKKKFWSENKKSGKKNDSKGPRERPHKFRLPDASENNRRVINGKPHTYNTARKRWFPDTNTAQTTSDSSTAATDTSSLTASTSPAAPSNESTQLSAVQQANLRRQMQAMQEQMTQLATSLT